ncbi:hypothetical protein [Candidatus Binatus sp.]|uniref:hypothetical protein n=1 Tax=Candidatus Binatus sp. TaxID=2811406 RepID=UPI003C4A84EC
MPEREANLAAAFKVARRAKLTDIVVTAITAKRNGELSGKIEPQLSDRYEILAGEENKLKILCRHSLEAASADQPVAEIHVDLNLIYDLAAGDPINEADLVAFANANGAYNSWPFIREMFNCLTLRLGLPGFVLPSLLLVNPKPPAPPAPTAPAAPTESPTE